MKSYREQREEDYLWRLSLPDVSPDFVLSCAERALSEFVKAAAPVVERARNKNAVLDLKVALQGAEAFLSARAELAARNGGAA